MANTEWLLEKAAQKTGWNLYSQIEVLCEYIDNQEAEEAFEEFLEEKVEGELRMSDWGEANKPTIE